MATDRSRPTILSLTSDVLTHILAHVASNSIEDLANAKLCCKTLHEASNSGLVFNKASMQKVPILPWHTSDKISMFAKLCEENRNPEAMYRQGMIDFLTYGDATADDMNIEKLRNAAMEGHRDASYVYGIFLIGQGGENRFQGLKVLNSIKDNKQGVFKFGRCRSKLRAFAQQVWVKEAVVQSLTARTNFAGTPRCLNCINNAQTRFNWPIDYDEHTYSVCECQLNEEYKLFCHIVSGMS